MKKWPKATRKRADNPEALILDDPLSYDETDYYEDGFSLKGHHDLALLLASIKDKAMVLYSKGEWRSSGMIC
ncbi:hypothetical protein [Cohnella abietis]|uniref:Uncharacterized protein n=1 Tax=Cohnella abietis TaxID=2507935 RepID=A0A3T1D618_9BACL|nr:hypothetical protein [Cohnella abietis]BBI33455.1 hypothetical protein KCTCHS21_28540 [Cohnella abietis]